MPEKPNDVDQYLDIGCGRCKFGGTPDCKVKSWTDELTLLRSILFQSDLTEEIKWSAPCYTYEGRNVLTLSALKESAVVSFFRGAELPDSENILEKPGENSRFARYVRFTDTKQIKSLKKVLLECIRVAIQLEKTGSKPRASEVVETQHPAELAEMFESDPKFAKAFFALTPGGQRGYLIHFSSAKQSKTRISRIRKCMPKIFEGKGWNER